MLLNSKLGSGVGGAELKLKVGVRNFSVPKLGVMEEHQAYASNVRVDHCRDAGHLR